MTAALGGLPIAVVIASMVALGWSTAAAGLAGTATAALVAIAWFDFGSRVVAVGPTLAIGGAILEACLLSATILWIIFPALCIYELQRRSGAFETIRKSLAALAPEPGLTALMVAWFFALFMEGVAGFGTPVALAAPILVGLGFDPIRAVAMALLGHAAGVSFGAVGTPVLPQAAATGLDGATLAWAPAVLHGCLSWILVTAVLILAGGPNRRASLAWGALAWLLFTVPSLLLARFAGPEIPTLGGAFVGGLAFAAILAARGRRPDAETPDIRALGHALLPYAAVLTAILLSRLVPEVRDVLRDRVFSAEWLGSFSVRFEPLYHPGTLLLAGFLAGSVAQGRSLSDVRAAASAAALRLAGVVLPLVAMLAMARIMAHAEMITAMAVAATAAGAVWPLLAPLIGTLGTFVTGSATASNIIFAGFQDATAKSLALPVPLLQGAQSFGAAIGNVICPHNIIAGSATVGIGGREADILRRTGPACLLYVLAGGVLVLLWA